MKIFDWTLFKDSPREVENAKGKWNNYHRFLNSFIIDAIKEGLMTRNPYNWLNIDRTQDTSLRNTLLLRSFTKSRWWNFLLNPSRG